MPDKSESLWELYASSEIVLWRRGLIVLVSIGFVNFLVQALLFALAVSAGNVEHILILGIAVTLFWLLFYFVWIGVHWIRWIWGGANLILGFALLIWAWRDNNGFGAWLGAISLIVGSYLCLGPSVYFFAKRQRETIRWTESLLVGAVCILILLSIGAASLGLLGYRHQRLEEACAFAMQASQRIYVDHDVDWVWAHATQHSLERGGRDRVAAFLDYTRRQLGQARKVEPANGMVQIRFHFPATIQAQAEIISKAEMWNGPVELRFLLWDLGAGWQIEHMRWNYLPIPEKSPVPR
jgi:hypothetical protein